MICNEGGKYFLGHPDCIGNLTNLLNLPSFYPRTPQLPISLLCCARAFSSHGRSQIQEPIFGQIVLVSILERDMHVPGSQHRKSYRDMVQAKGYRLGSVKVTEKVVYRANTDGTLV